MTQTEFLQELKKSLDGEVESSIVQETVNYYSEYIRNAVAEGQSEESVLQTLGPARLIAKSIIEANSVRKENEEIRRNRQDQDENPKSKPKQGFTFRSWYGRLILILLALAVVGIILALVVGAVVAVWYLLPVIAVIVLIVVLVRIFLRIGKN